MTTTDTEPARRRRPLALALITALLTAATTAVVVAVLVKVVERKHEARHPFMRVVDLDEATVDPKIWAKNFPHQYDGYARTVDQVRTRFGGSEAVPRTPTAADPRSIVSQSRLEEDPRLTTFWAGYAFSHDFNEERGHAFMLTDQRLTKRQQVVQQPGACLHCHASVVSVYRDLGKGDLVAGFDAINKMPYAEATKLVQHAVACLDCHDPKTMQLRVTRPAFILAMARMKQKQGVQGYDVNRDATRQEMRSFVCGQCHVEYHFAGKDKVLTFPWDGGMKADQILAYYDEVDFADWTHAKSGARTLKAQHPEFELYNQGTHARAGVACADCHMPYQRVGAVKVSDHHIRSPLLNINAACQTCHRATEEDLASRARTIQERTFTMRNVAMDALMSLIADLEKARASGRPDQDLAPARQQHRRAQFLLDFIEAENSMGFHADQESMRVLALSLEAARLGQVLVREPGYRPTFTAALNPLQSHGAAAPPVPAPPPVPEQKN